MLNKNDIKDGEIYWTCLPSIESINYEDYTPVLPRQKKAKWQQNNCGIVLYLCFFNKDTGEIDEDSNSKSLVDFVGQSEITDEVFLTYAEAAHHYNDEVRILAKHFRNKSDELLKSIITV